MTYRISYDCGWAPRTAARQSEGTTRTEYFSTEFEALTRARELIEDGDHHAVSLRDDSGRVVTGVPLQLTLGASATD